METIDVSWHDDARTIIYYRFPKSWSWNEFWEAFDQSYEMGATVEHRIDIVADLTESSFLPTNTLTHYRAITQRQHDHAHMSIIVTPLQFLQVLYKVAKSINPDIRHEFALCATVEEAFEMIERSRADEATEAPTQSPRTR